ncbi:MAG: oligosaccharide flippase family protein [Methylobacter sp.]|nr:oligosaccharide flippase family protein [Methylobacter sp.]
MGSLLLKLEQWQALARFTPFDTSTEEGRSSERHRLILLSAAASALAKIVSVTIALISVPLTLHYLGAERFGLWMTISSVIAMLSFADLGIGNGLLNAIAEAKGKDDYQGIRRYISSAFAILSVIALLVLLVFYVIYPFVPWAGFFNVKSPLAMQEAGRAIAIFVLCFALHIPAGVVQRVQMGLQMGFVANLWQMAASLLALGSVLLVINFEMGLPWLVGGMAGIPVLVAALNGLSFFKKVRPDIRPNWNSVCRQAMKKIAHIGLLFLVLQIAGAITFASDNIVIAKLLGAEAVAKYAIPEKLFSVIPLILGMFLMPLWPAYGEAISRKDGAWVKRIFFQSMALSVIFALIMASFLCWFAEPILNLWVGEEVHPPLLLLVGIGAWKIIEACGNAFAMLLNGANIVRAQVVIAILLAIISIALKIFLVQQVGLAGVVWATCAAYILCTLIPYCLLMPKILKYLTSKNQGIIVD